MTDDLTERLAAVAAAPEGPTVAAYVDFDGTVIAGYSAGAFYRRRLLDRAVGVPELVRTVAAGVRGIETPADFTAFLELTLSSWAGRPEAEVTALGRRIMTEELAGRLHREIWDLVQAHRARGHRVVIASSAT